MHEKRAYLRKLSIMEVRMIIVRGQYKGNLSPLPVPHAFPGNQSVKSEPDTLITTEHHHQRCKHDHRMGVTANGLSTTEAVADAVHEYCYTHSEPLPQHIIDHAASTEKRFDDADMMVSKPEAQFLIWFAKAQGAKRSMFSSSVLLVLLGAELS